MSEAIDQAERDSNREHELAVALAHLEAAKNSSYSHDRLYGSGDDDVL